MTITADQIRILRKEVESILATKGTSAGTAKWIGREIAMKYDLETSPQSEMAVEMVLLDLAREKAVRTRRLKSGGLMWTLVPALTSGSDNPAGPQEKRT